MTEKELEAIVRALQERRALRIKIAHQAAARILRDFLHCRLEDITAQELSEAQRRIPAVEAWFSAASPAEIAWAIRLAYGAH